MDPENDQFIVETSLPTPMNARVYVNIPEGRHVLWLDFVLVKNHGTCVLSLMVAQRKLTSYVTDGCAKWWCSCDPLKSRLNILNCNGGKWREVAQRNDPYGESMG